jgi:hypothetical protein
VSLPRRGIVAFFLGEHGPEDAGIGNRRRQRTRGDRAHAQQFTRALRRRTVPGVSRDLRVTARKPDVQRGEVLMGLQQQGTHPIGKPAVFGQLRKGTQEPIGRATNDDPVFGE